MSYTLLDPFGFNMTPSCCCCCCCRRDPLSFFSRSNVADVKAGGLGDQRLRSTDHGAEVASHRCLSQVGHHKLVVVVNFFKGLKMSFQIRKKKKKNYPQQISSDEAKLVNLIRSD